MIVMSFQGLDILEFAAKLQMTMSDQVIRTDIIRDIIYRASDLLATGTKIFPPQGVTDQLEGVFMWPSEMDEVQEVEEGEVGDLDDITWMRGNWTLSKFRKAFMLTDESKIRGVNDIEQNVSAKSRGDVRKAD